MAPPAKRSAAKRAAQQLQLSAAEFTDLTDQESDRESRHSKKQKKNSDTVEVGASASSRPPIPTLPKGAWVRKTNGQNTVQRGVLYSTAKSKGAFGSEKRVLSNIKRPQSEAGRSRRAPSAPEQLPNDEWIKLRDICTNFTDVIGYKLTPAARDILFRILINFESTNYRQGPGPPTAVQQVLEHLSDEVVPYRLEGSSWNLFYFSEQ